MSRLNSAIPVGDVDSAAVDTLDGHGIEEFDWETVYARLDGELAPHDREQLALALRRLLLWLVDGLGERNGVTTVALRVIGLVWQTDPGLIPDSPSLRQLAKRFGVSKSALSNYAAEAGRVFGVRNRASIGHAWNFKTAPETPATPPVPGVSNPTD